jgi:hypothetical protein
MRTKSEYCLNGHSRIPENLSGRNCKICINNRKKKNTIDPTHCKNGHEYTPENIYINPNTKWKYCRVCSKNSRNKYKNKNYPGKSNERARHLMRRYRMTIEDYNRMYDAQNGCCSICDKHLDQLQVDHDHETEKVRQLLCKDCNVGLGSFFDSIDLLKRAEAYLDKHKDK